MQKLAKFNCSKNKQTKAVNQIKKATSYMLLRRCNRCSSAVCLQDKNKQIKKFVYKSAVEHTLKQTQVTQIFHCRHSKKSEFPTHRSPTTHKEKISKTKNPHDFFSKEISLVQYMNKKKKEHQNIQLRSQAHPRNPPGKMNKKKNLRIRAKSIQKKPFYWAFHQVSFLMAFFFPPTIFPFFFALLF